jgi:hypothetical protein
MVVRHPPDPGGQDFFGDQLESLPGNLKVKLLDHLPSVSKNLFTGHPSAPFRGPPPQASRLENFASNGTNKNAFARGEGFFGRIYFLEQKTTFGSRRFHKW